jgi:hypothetical protein
MILAAGSKLGSYEIVAPPGAGGMGKEYRARDTRLNPITPGWSRYVSVARHPPEALHGAGTSSVRKTRASMQRSWKLCVADIKALNQAAFDSKHVTDHLIR